MARPMQINGVYYFRQRVPRDLIKQVGRRWIKESLRTSDPAIARNRAERSRSQVLGLLDAPAPPSERLRQARGDSHRWRGLSPVPGEPEGRGQALLGRSPLGMAASHLVRRDRAHRPSEGLEDEGAAGLGGA
jgi:hypothetical protein